MLHTRKRLQKVVFLLQAAGCPFDDDTCFTITARGPRKWPGCSDEMVRAGLLKEQSQENPVGLQNFLRSHATCHGDAGPISEVTQRGQQMAEQCLL